MLHTSFYRQSKNSSSTGRTSFLPICANFAFNTSAALHVKPRKNLSEMQERTAIGFYNAKLPARLPKGINNFVVGTRRPLHYQRLLEERNLWAKRRKDLTFYGTELSSQQISIKNIRQPQELLKKPLSNISVNERQKSEDTKKLSAEYRFGESIGRGAYATVREATHTRLNKPVAIKIYDKALFAEPRRKKRIMLEIEILKMLRHKNIVRYYDTFQSPSHLYLVMELVKGISLREYVKAQPNRRVREKKALKMFKEVVIAVDYCHENNIFHRDIKLDNILVDRTGNIKLIDFGFSIFAHKDQRLRTHCGTLSYMAPEIVRKRDYCGGPVDMWALGVILYSMLFGRYPFSGTSDSELVQSIKEGAVKFPDEVAGSTQRIVKRLLEVNPDKRLTARELLVSLSNE